MDPIRIFSLLAERVPPFDAQPGSTGRPEYDMATAASLCAGMPERAYRAAMAIWGIDPSVRERLRIELWMALMETAQRERWKTAGRKVDGKEVTLVLAEIALAQIYDNPHWGQPEHWAKRARALGVERSAYFETWHDRIAQALNILDDWAADGRRYVVKRMNG